MLRADLMTDDISDTLRLAKAAEAQAVKVTVYEPMQDQSLAFAYLRRHDWPHVGQLQECYGTLPHNPHASSRAVGEFIVRVEAARSRA